MTAVFHKKEMSSFIEINVNENKKQREVWRKRKLIFAW